MRDFLKFILTTLAIGGAGIFSSILFFNKPILFFIWSALYCAGIGWAFYWYIKDKYCCAPQWGANTFIAVFLFCSLLAYDTKHQNLEMIELTIITIVSMSLIGQCIVFAKKKVV